MTSASKIVYKAGFFFVGDLQGKVNRIGINHSGDFRVESTSLKFQSLTSINDIVTLQEDSSLIAICGQGGLLFAEVFP